jgi:hypothetical protein
MAAKIQIPFLGKPADRKSNNFLTLLIQIPAMFSFLSGILKVSCTTLIAGVFLVICFSSCSKNKYYCDANRPRNYHKIKKNKSNYGALYSPKTKPVPKNYMIKNGR